MENMDAIMDRIRKLHAKAESAKEIGSLHEAESFAAAVQKMLLKYKLDMSTVQASENAASVQDAIDISHILWDEYGVKSTSRRCAWIEYLCNGICKPLNCMFMITPGSNAISVIGRGLDRQVAVFLIGKLVAKANLLATEAYTQEWKKNVILGNVEKTRGYRAAWLAGFSRRIALRMEQEYAKEEIANPGLALIRQKDVVAVREHVKKLGGRKPSDVRGRQTNNMKGVLDGVAAANRENLKEQGISANGGGTQSQVGEGRKLLSSGS